MIFSPLTSQTGLLRGYDDDETKFYFHTTNKANERKKKHETKRNEIKTRRF